MASGGGGGGCACPGQSKLNSIATTKHAVSMDPAILLGGSEGSAGEWQRGREQSQDKASLAVAGGAGDVPLPSRCKSFLAATWALGEGGNARLQGRGGAVRGGAGRGGARGHPAGRGEANCAAKGRWRACGYEAPGCGD